jgi:toxin YhaV
MFADPCFLASVESLQSKVQSLRQKHSETWMKKDAAKRLAVIAKLALQSIPEDPTRDIYRQGTTLGNANKSWRRAKFYQQYRLFFRYHLGQKALVYGWVYGWVNGPDTKRAYNSKTDAYQVFQKMIEIGHPPNDWNDLLRGAQAQGDRLSHLFDQIDQI